ncbi:hypothetical protein P7K49_037638, partial [Saguinus oedipus]
NAGEACQNDAPGPELLVLCRLRLYLTPPGCFLQLTAVYSQGWAVPAARSERPGAVLAFSTQQAIKVLVPKDREEDRQQRHLEDWPTLLKRGWVVLPRPGAAAPFPEALWLRQLQLYFEIGQNGAGFTHDFEVFSGCTPLLAVPLFLVYRSPGCTPLSGVPLS